MMFKETLFFLFLFLSIFLQITCHGKDNNNNPCSPSSCGSIHNISYPFRLRTDPKNCGNHKYTLVCENNSTVLYLYSGKYYVQAINYNNYTIRVVDSSVDKDDCSSLPHLPLTSYNFSLEDPFSSYKSKPNGSDFTPQLSTLMALISCPFPVNSPLYVNTAPCINNINGGVIIKHLYVNVVGMEAKDLRSGCSLEMMAMLPEKDYNNMSFIEIHGELAYGFELSWHYIFCGRCRGCYFDERNEVQCLSSFFTRVCYLNFGIRCLYLFDSTKAYAHFYRIAKSTPTVLVLLVLLHSAIKTLCGTPFVFGFLIYKWRRRHLSEYHTVEEFLQSHNNLIPIRYSYKDVRKMTAEFKEKLGEGGFGSVYKAKLRSGHIAAVKMLNKSKTKGQDFINEVATLGRIYHANVVRLIGFCVEGSKHALVFDFMPNGSLNNHVFSQQGLNSLSWDKLYEISLGIARGIEYLHQGCDMQILHFDIKPHNILLDENFIPKISDFGLAKLYATDDSIKSLTAARGTVGYMAPELFYRNIGHVSHKADVYSYGMLLLEMTGKRKNLNATTENSSENYFPFWVYDEISDGKFIGIGDTVEEETNKIAKKMVVVGLWCIQMNPSNRPPMNKVIEMLEADLESLQLPPRSAMNPEETPIEDAEETLSSSVDFSETSSLIENSF